jgi:hypothetical protein
MILTLTPGHPAQDAMNHMVRAIMSVDTWSWPLSLNTDADDESDLGPILQNFFEPEILQINFRRQSVDRLRPKSNT